MYITAQMLRDAWDCTDQGFMDQVDAFEEEWPRGTEANLASVTRAVELDLNIQLFAYRFLPPKAREAWLRAENRAQEAYRQAKDIAMIGYCFGCAAQAEYEKAIAWQAYQQATITALLSAIQGMTT